MLLKFREINQLFFFLSICQLNVFVFFIIHIALSTNIRKSLYAKKRASTSPEDLKNNQALTGLLFFFSNIGSSEGRGNGSTL